MPKKLNTNIKSLEARERKEAIKKATNDRIVKELEDSQWQDDDKILIRKQQRRNEEERKRSEIARRKAESRALLDQEMSKIRTQGKQSLARINRQQILEEMGKKQKFTENTIKSPSNRIITTFVEKNLNRSMLGVEIANNVDEALAILNLNDGDKHPEKRMREAFRKFEISNLPRIKAENPSLRTSQCKQMLVKEWSKSNLNPYNKI